MASGGSAPTPAHHRNMLMSLIGNWSYPTAIKFGAGRIKELVDACAQAGIKKPLLVTDKGLADLPVTKSTLDIM